jgi:protein-S-isoprenylcysteine O-methyltransferase Ste14
MNTHFVVWLWLAYLALSFVVWPSVFRAKFGRWPFAYAFPPTDSATLVDCVYALVLALYTGALLIGDPIAPQSLAGGLALFGVGYALQMWAIVTMGRHWRFGRSSRDDTAEFVSHGAFRVLRHPIYASIIIIAFAMGLLAGFDGRAALLIFASCLYFGIQGRAETLHWRARTQEEGV